MHEIINLQTMIKTYGTILPLSILLLENDKDREFITSFYLEHRRFMLYLAKQRVENLCDAEDIVEDAIESLLGKLPTLKTMTASHVRYYLATTIRNTSFNYFRRNAKHYRHRIDFAEEPNALEQMSYEDGGLDEFIFNRFNVNEFLAGFHSLSQTDKDLIMLRHYDNFSVDEIAQILGMDHDTVSNRLYKAKKRAIREAEVLKKANS